MFCDIRPDMNWLYGGCERLADSPADTVEMIAYIFSRSRQALWRGFRLDRVGRTQGVWRAVYTCNGDSFQSIFLMPDQRGKGLYETLVKGRSPKPGDTPPRTVLTFESCGIQGFLTAKNIKSVCLPDLSGANPLQQSYAWIRRFYGDKRAERSQVLYMNHIDEGLYVLRKLGASDEVKAAYCLHPIYQSQPLPVARETLKTLGVREGGVSPKVEVLALEYAEAANAYLSNRSISHITEIRMPSVEVAQMLIADKVQNYKDFKLFHGDHPRALALRTYFQNWFARLGLLPDVSVYSSDHSREFTSWHQNVLYPLMSPGKTLFEVLSSDLVALQAMEMRTLGVSYTHG